MEEQKNISVKCLVHKQYIYGVCMNKTCKENSRLTCFHCLTSFHHDHVQKVVSLAEIKGLNKDNCNWPSEDDKVGHQVKSLLQNLQRIKSKNDIDTLFSDLISDITKSANEIRDKLKNQFDQQAEQKANFTTNLEQGFQIAYSLNGILSILSELESGNINQIEANDEVNKFLEYDQAEKKNLFENLKALMQDQQLKTFIVPNQKQIEELTDKCCSNVQELASIMNYKLVPPYLLQIIQVKDYQTVQMVEEGKNFQMNGLSVVGGPILKTGKYTMKIRFENVQSPHIVFGIERFQNKINSQYWGTYPMVCVTCHNLDAISFALTQGGQYLGAFSGQGRFFKIIIHISQNLFRISSANDESIMQANAAINQQGEQYFFFVNNYSGQPTQINMFESEYEED